MSSATLLPGIEHLEDRRLLSADLAISFKGSPPDVLPLDHPARIAVRITNQGDAAVSGAAIALFASSDASLDGSDAFLAGGSTTKTIQPGRSIFLKVPVSTPGSLTDGEYHLIARGMLSDGSTDADPSKDVAAAASTVSVRQPFVDLAVAVTGQPGRAISTVGFHGRPPPRGKASVDVFNRGNITANGNVDVELYLSTSGALDATAIHVATASSHLRLKSGKAASVPVKFRLPETMPAGTYTLVAKIVPEAALADREALNNQVVGPQAVQVVNTPQKSPHYHHCRHHYRFVTGEPIFCYDDPADYVPSEESWIEPPPDDGQPGPDTGPSTQPSTGPSTQPENSSDDGGGDSGEIDYTGGETDSGSDDTSDADGGDSGDSGGDSGGGDSGSSDGGGDWGGDSGGDSGGGDFGGGDDW